MKKHVMLSYQWDSQEFVQEVSDFLSKGSIPVWMDIQGGITADLVQCMAEGVEEAAAVIFFCTKAYQISVNCKTELIYARQLEKPIIPVICDENYTKIQVGINEPDPALWPCGWLGATMAGKVYVDFRKASDESRKIKFKELITQIETLTEFKYTNAKVSTEVCSQDKAKILALEQELEQVKLTAKSQIIKSRGWVISWLY